MKVLVIGAGGREHAIVWKLAQSPDVSKIYCTPGNPGIAKHAECIAIAPNKKGELLAFALEMGIDLTVVGPEDPLVNGIVDTFRKRDLRIFGPTARAARLEGSKAYAKEVMQRNTIATAQSRTFRDYDLAMQHLEGAVAPLVVKADGLAAGKGVTICRTVDEARETVRKMMREELFGEAGAQVVLEEYLEGEEMSILAISDGNTIVPFPPAQDHKPIFDGDKGPNTGGMGTYSPVPQFSDEMIHEIENEVVVQAIHAMNREGEPFRGCLFTGLMVTEDGPKVLEFNVRFGDPEVQSVIPRLKSDLFPLLWHACDGTLDQCEVEFDARAAVTVVLASGGYPGKANPPTRIKGLDQDFGDDVVIFHAGTKREGNQIMTAGGRVLAVSALADTLAGAREKAYAAVAGIHFEGMQFRTDIGSKGVSPK